MVVKLFWLLVHDEFSMFRDFLIAGDVGFVRLICGLTELFGGFYWYWVATTRVFLFWVLVTTMDTTACKLVDPTLLS